MDREELLGIRKKLFDEYDERKSLGEFDANSRTTLVILESNINIVNHLLEELKKKPK